MVDVCEVFEIPEFDVSGVPEVPDVSDAFDVPEMYPEVLYLCYVFNYQLINYQITILIMLYMLWWCQICLMYDVFIYCINVF